MKELAGRLSAADPNLGDAVRIISYFDELLAHRGGFESIVRGAAVLAGAPARLSLPRRRLPVRVLPDGRRDDLGDLPEPDWQSIALPDFGATLWLERTADAGTDVLILERAAIALRAALDRSPHRFLSHQDDPALIEIMVDPESDPATRAQAARSLGIKSGQLVRAIAQTGEIRLEVVDPGRDPAPLSIVDKAGVGPSVTVEDAPRSAREAGLALRFTTAATASNPQGAIAYSEELGVLTLLATIADGPERHADIDTLKDALIQGPSWLLETLDALATTESLRSAARILVVHHSTLQRRLGQIAKTLGWDVTTPVGKLRLQVTLLLRRLSSA